LTIWSTNLRWMASAFVAEMLAGRTGVTIVIIADRSVTRIEG
jgi:hypothetical protein